MLQADMTDTVQVILGLVFLAVVFIGTRYVIVIRLRHAARAIIQDLEKQNALSELNAVELPYSKTDFLRIGMRDYKRKALEYMVSEGVIGSCANGKYYLKIPTKNNI